MAERDILTELIGWFSERNPARDIDVSMNYYKSGLVDSFGIVELISFAEETFDVEFVDEDFSDPTFRTINGLVAIVEKRSR